MDDEQVVNSWWAQIPSKDERKDLKRLLRRTRLNAPFRALAKIPALGRGLLAGSVGSMLKVKCDEEIVRYLNHIHDFWTMLVGNGESELRKVDSYTVACLQSRVPALSKSDECFLKKELDAGNLFQHFTRSEKERIWQRLRSYPRRVPSVRLFFRDLIYLEVLAGCLKVLVRPVRRQSIYEAFSAAFDDRALQSVSTATSRPSFEKSYRTLLLSIMRQLESLRPGSVMLEKAERRKAVSEDPSAWHRLAEEAYSLGFRSPQLDVLRFQQADRVAASTFLKQMRNPRLFEYEDSVFESLIDQVVAALNQARRKELTQERPCLTVGEDGEDCQRRAGRPYHQAYEQSAKFLTYSNIYGEIPSTQGEPTAFFVQRDIFWSFFGPLADSDFSMTDGQYESTSPNENIRPDVMDRPESSVGIMVGHGTYGESHTAGDENLRSPRQQQSQNSVSPSEYSQVSAARNATSLVITDRPGSTTARDLHQGDSERSTGHIIMLLKFVSLAGPRPEIVAQYTITDANEHEVESLAGAYARIGMFLYNRQMRSLCPQDCLEEAKADQSDSIFLIPGNRSSTAAEVTLIGLKRPGDEIMSGRPRKMYLTM